MNVSHWSDLPLVLTSKQAAAVLQLKPRTVANMLDRGDLQGVKIGKEWRVSRAELMRFVLGGDDSGTNREAQDKAAILAERTPAVINKAGVLVVQAEPLDDLAEFVRQERDRRVAALLEQAGM
jgi:excisionase family DNA binding protein